MGLFEYLSADFIVEKTNLRDISYSIIYNGHETVFEPSSVRLYSCLTQDSLPPLPDLSKPHSFTIVESMGRFILCKVPSTAMDDMFS